MKQKKIKNRNKLNEEGNVKIVVVNIQRVCRYINGRTSKPKTRTKTEQITIDRWTNWKMFVMTRFVFKINQFDIFSQFSMWRFVFLFSFQFSFQFSYRYFLWVNRKTLIVSFCRSLCWWCRELNSCDMTMNE